MPAHDEAVPDAVGMRILKSAADALGGVQTLSGPSVDALLPQIAVDDGDASVAAMTGW